mgnify:CR=1 FL=1
MAAGWRTSTNWNALSLGHPLIIVLSAVPNNVFNSWLERVLIANFFDLVPTDPIPFCVASVDVDSVSEALRFHLSFKKAFFPLH